MALSTTGRRRRPSVAPQAATPQPPRADHFTAPAGALGQILLQRGLVSVSDLRFTLMWQRSLNGDWPVQRLGSLLVKAGLLSVLQVSEILAEQHGVIAAPSSIEVPRQVPPWLRGLFPHEVLRQYGAVPLYVAGHTLVIGMTDPHRREQLAALQSMTRYTLQPVLILQLQAQKLLRSIYLAPPAGLSSHPV